LVQSGGRRFIVRAMRNLPAWALSVLSVAGVVMVVSMVLPWIDFGGMISSSGLSIAWHDSHWMFIVPISGAALASAAATKSAHTRLAATVAGLAVAGDVVYALAKDALTMSMGSWLVIGGALVVLLGVPAAHRQLRVIGGVAMLIGFFVAGGIHTDTWSLTGSGIAVAGVVAAISGCSTSPKAGWAAIVAGLTPFALIVLGIGFTAFMVFGIGAWSAFAASLAALVIALAVPATTEPA
jgi:hypothetical protein